MATCVSGRSDAVSMRTWFGSAFRLLASLKLAIWLILLLASTLCVATLLEANHGIAYAHWYVYKSHWFSTLLGLLGVNIFCAAAVRFPWKRHQMGFVMTHAGLLVLLAGAVHSFLAGIDGQVALMEGETVSQLTLPERSQVTATWEGRPDEAPFEFSFDGGPVDWRAGRTLHVGEMDGVRARILRFYRHARPVAEWVTDVKEGGPLLKFQMTGPDGKKVAEHYLADEQLGDALFVGPIRLQLQRATCDSMLSDFLDPAPANRSDDGLLLAYYQDAVERVPVRGNVGKKIAIGHTGAAVEIKDSRFTSPASRRRPMDARHRYSVLPTTPAGR